MKLLLYSFRTFPDQEFLRKHDAFVFGELKQDLEVFKETIISEQPNLILGIARKHNGKSQFEVKAVNQFHSDKQIIKGGVAEYLLDVPEVIPQGFTVAREPTRSFCNWTMYQISHFISQQNLPSRCVFCHVNLNDLIRVEEWFLSGNELFL